MNHARLPILSLPLLLSLAVLFSCSSQPARPVFSDYLEVREVKSDDPLAAKFTDAEGEEYRLGDPIVTGKATSRLQVKRVSDERYDLLVTLLAAEDARWRRFARSRGRQAALVIDGRVRCVFDVADPGEAKENEVLVVAIPNAAQTEEEAARLDTFLEERRTARKRSVTE